MKKIRVMLLLALIVVLFCGAGALADQLTESISYEVEGTKLVFSGEGGVPDRAWDISKTPPWGTAITEVEIGEGITRLGTYLFFEHSKVKTVSLPNTLTSIGFSCFSGCTSLQSITVPEKVTSIEIQAFSGCSRMTSATIKGTIIEISDNTFSNCNTLASIVLPETVTEIGYAAFAGCKAITDLSFLPSGLTTIGNNAFQDCTRLTTAILPQSVESIGKSCFQGCDKLTSVKLSENIVEIPNSAFQKCAFADLEFLPKGLKSIGDNAFGYCSNLTTASLPNSVESIGTGCFQECRNLTSVTLPEIITEIPNSAFQGCSSLYISLPETITWIGDKAFDGAVIYTDFGSNIAKLLVETGSVFRIPGTKFSMKYSGEDLIICNPVDNDITCADIPDGVTEISSCTFTGYGQKVSWARFPKSLKTIRDNAFDSNLVNVFYPGTETDRNNIIIEQQYGDVLTNAVWHYGEEVPANPDVAWNVTYDIQSMIDPEYYWPSLRITATGVCGNNPNHVISETLERVFVDTSLTGGKAATCEADGLGKATVSFQHTVLNPPDREMTVVIPPSGHTWGNPVYAWGFGNKTLTASATCKYDLSHVLTETVNTKSSVDPATGNMVYTGEFTNPLFESQTKIGGPSGYDITPPQLKKITIDTKNVTKPGVLKITIEFVEEETGLSQICITSKSTEAANLEPCTIFLETPLYSGSYTMNIPISTQFPAGLHYVTVVTLTDSQGNTITYTQPANNENTDELIAYDYNNTAPMSGPVIIDRVTIENGFTIEEERSVAFQLHISNPNLVSQINEIPDGKYGIITYDKNNHIASKDLFDAIKGKDKNLVFSNDGYQWTFNGRDVVNETKDIDLQIFSQKIPGKGYGFSGDLLMAQFASNGTLPGKAKVRIKADYFYTIFRMQNAAYLYYVSGEGPAEEITLESATVGCVIDDNNHWAEFDVTHNSTFLISGTKRGEGQTSTVTVKDGVYKLDSKTKIVSFIKPANNTVQKLVIQDKIKIGGKSYPVKGIAAGACKGLKNLKTVKIGKNVTTIEKNAFAGCEALKTVSGGANVENIKDGAFSGCKALTKYTFGAKVTNIGKKAFYNCAKLKTLTFKGTGKLKVGSGAFQGIAPQAKAKVPKKVEKEYSDALKKKGKLPKGAKVNNK